MDYFSCNPYISKEPLFLFKKNTKKNFRKVVVRCPKGRFLCTRRRRSTTSISCVSFSRPFNGYIFQKSEKKHKKKKIRKAHCPKGRFLCTRRRSIETTVQRLHFSKKRKKNKKNTKNYDSKGRRSLSKRTVLMHEKRCICFLKRPFNGYIFQFFKKKQKNTKKIWFERSSFIVQKDGSYAWEEEALQVLHLAQRDWACWSCGSWVRSTSTFFFSFASV